MAVSFDEGLNASVRGREPFDRGVPAIYVRF
jgi:hypothetical protein